MTTTLWSITALTWGLASVFSLLAGNWLMAAVQAELGFLSGAVGLLYLRAAR